MPTPAPFPLRPRSATEIIDAAFQLYRQEFIPLLTLSTLSYLPQLILSVVQLSLVPSSGQLDFNNVSVAVVYAATLLCQLLWYGVLTCSVILGVSERIMGRAPEPLDVMRRVLRRFWPILRAVILKGLIMFGFVFGILLVVGIPIGLIGAFSGVGPLTMLAALPFVLAAMAWVLARFFAVPGVTILESLGARESLKRSSQLSDGLKWKIVISLVLVYLIMGALIGASVIVVYLTGASVLAQIAVGIGSLLVHPLIAATIVFLYYDARIVKEGYDLELMESELSPERAETAAPAIE
jgi:hypothetical protein